MSQLNHPNATADHRGAQFAAILAEARRLCESVAKVELAGSPLYVVPQSRIADRFGVASRCYAYTTPSLDLYLRDYLDDWQGRGSCLVVNDLAIAEDYHPSDHREILLCIAMHELAHILDRPQLVATSDKDADEILFELLVVANVTDRDPTTEPRYGHGPSFIRLAIHLVARARRLGYDLRFAGVCPTHRYGLSPVGEYVQSLRRELNKSPTSLRQLLSAAPPISFTKLWQSDTQTPGENP